LKASASRVRDDDIARLLDEHAAPLRRYGDRVLRGDLSTLEGVDWWEFRNE
jgi:hypothetical protein